MPAYVVVQINVNDPQAMGEYAAAVPAVTEQYGGRYLWAGPGVENLEGDWSPDGFAILQFDDREAALRWYNSPEYAPLREKRQSVGPTSAIITPDVPS